MAHYSEIEPGAGYAVSSPGPSPAASSAASTPRSLSWRLKSAMDRLGALLLLIAVAPLMAMVALAVRFDSPGPVFFRQPRFGAGREVVVVTKFRTMRPEGTDIGGRRQATRDDN